MNYLNEFNKLISELKEDSQIELLESKINGPISIHSINYAENEYCVQIPDDLKSFYLQLNGVKIKWISKKQTDDGAPEYTGDIDILPLFHSFEGVGDEDWENDIWNNEMDEEVKIRCKCLKPFDIFDNDDSGYICYDFDENGVLLPRLVLHSVNYGLIALKYGFKDYIKYSLKYKGVYPWQYMSQDVVEIYDHKFQLEKFETWKTHSKSV
jgi:hypothetical protein